MSAALDARALARLVRIVVVLAMGWSALLLLGMALWTGESPLAWLRSIGAPLAAAVVATFAANHLLRFVRWHLMLRAEGFRVPWPRSLSIFLAGLALLPTPAKAGVAARALLLIREGVPVHVSLAAYFAERLLDLVGLVILASFVLAGLDAASRWALAALLGAAGISLVVLAPHLLRAARPRFAPHARAGRALEWLSMFFADAAKMMSGWRLPVFVLLGMAANALTGWLLWRAMRDTGAAVDVAGAVGAVAVSHLSGSLTLTPGGLGGFEVALLAQLAAAGAPSLAALTALAVVRIVTLWGSVAVGLPFLGLGLRRGAA